jgi:hypothetical protein
LDADVSRADRRSTGSGLVTTSRLVSRLVIERTYQRLPDDADTLVQTQQAGHADELLGLVAAVEPDVGPRRQSRDMG